MAAKELAILLRAMGADKAAKDVGKVAKSIDKIGESAKKGLSNAASNLTKIGIAAGTAVAGAVAAGAQSLADLSRVQQQTAAVLISTNYASGQTTGSIRLLAQQMEDLTTVDDKTVQAGENLLLTFTNIGRDVFPSATAAMVNMGIAMNGGTVEGLDLSSTAVQLGKALNDPIKGVTALRKVGVQLSDQQEKQIKDFVKAGKIEEAQKVILGELATEFGKAGEAAGQDFGANIRRLKDAGEDLSMALATGLMPVIQRATTWLRNKLTDPAVIARIKSLGDELAVAGGKFLDWIDTVDFGQILSMVGQVKDAGVTLVQAFMSMPDWVKQAVVTGWGLNKLTGGAVGEIVGELGKGLIKGVLGINAGVVNVNAASVRGGGGVPGAGGAAAAGGTSLASKAAFGLGTVVSGIALVEVLQNAWNDPNDGIGQAIKGAIGGATFGDLQAKAGQNNDAATIELRTGSDRQLREAIEGLQKIPDSLNPIQKALYEMNASGVKVHNEDLIAAFKSELASRDSSTEALLRANLTRPIPPPNVTVNVSTSVSVRSIIDATSELYRSGSRTRVMAN